MRRRGRPLEPLNDAELRNWLELEIETLLVRRGMTHTASFIRDIATEIERYHSRWQRLQKSVGAAVVADDLIETYTAVADGRMPLSFQGSYIVEAFGRQGYWLTVEAVKRANIDQAELSTAGGAVRFAVRVVADLTGVSANAINEQRAYRARESARVVDTLRPEYEMESRH